ncbi:MAG: response regulator transcription factor [candidate division WS1 bacterium]|jgi:DNA-binding response OmpR family regulator|nr:response regulator transcription factor [candidate division WS1 bacterium]
MSVGTILHVEDDPNIAFAIERRLSKVGYDVVGVDRGRPALDCADRRAIDVVVLDLMLPDIPGERFLTLLREKSNMPVIVTSARSELETRVDLLREGADDFLVKPFDLKELECRIEAVLRRSRSAGVMTAAAERGDPSYSTLKYEDIELCIDSREVYVRGDSVDVSPTEFKLLRYLMERPGTAVGAEQLIECVWGYDGYDRHIVEANIHRLRRKVEVDPTNPERILTVRGYGYMFGASSPATAMAAAG